MCEALWNQNVVPDTGITLLQQVMKCGCRIRYYGMEVMNFFRFFF